MTCGRLGLIFIKLETILIAAAVLAGPEGLLLTGFAPNPGSFQVVQEGSTMSGNNGLMINRNVLMLNQNYEPLTVCSARRAIVLLFQGKAEMIEAADGLKIRTVSTGYALPSVVRLWKYRRVPFKRIMLSRKNIITRDGHRCQYCGTSKGSMTIDHVIPKKLNGSDTWENMVCACIKCNNKKGHRSPERAGLQLQKKPTRPSHITFIQRHISGEDQRWRPYLFMD